MTWIHNGKYFHNGDWKSTKKYHVEDIRGIWGKRFLSFNYPRVLELIDELRPKNHQNILHSSSGPKIFDILTNPDKIKRYSITIRKQQ